MNWIHRLRDIYLSRPAPVHWWNESGLHTEGRDVAIDIPWQQIDKVYVYKKDCYTVDQIRVLFISKEHAIEFTENDDAFTGLCASMEQHLDIPPTWFLDIMVEPAFSLSMTCLYAEGLPVLHSENLEKRQKD